MFQFFNDIGFMSASETPKPDSDQPSQPPSRVGDGSMGASGAASEPRLWLPAYAARWTCIRPGSGPRDRFCIRERHVKSSVRFCAYAQSGLPLPAPTPPPDCNQANRNQPGLPPSRPAPGRPRSARRKKNYICHHSCGSGPNGWPPRSDSPWKAHRSPFWNRGYHRRRNPAQRAHSSRVSAR